MQRRTLLALAGAAAVAVGAAVLLTPKPTTAPEGEAAPLAFPGLAVKLAEAGRIELRKPDATLAVVRQGEAWVLPDHGGYPVRGERVRELLVGLTELRLTEPRTADPAQLGRLGLDDPAQPGSTAVLLRVLSAGDLPVAELVVGRRRVRTAGNVPETVYVRRPAEQQAWLAEGRLSLDTDAQVWLDRDVANIGQDRIRRVTVRRADEPELLLVRAEGPEGKLRPEPAQGATDAVALDEVARGFEYLTFLDVKPERETPGDPLGESSFALEDGGTVTVAVNRVSDQVWIRLKAAGGADAGRLNARWQGWAYQLGSWKEKAFLPRREELRERPATPEQSGAPEQPAAPEAPATQAPPG